VTTKTTERHEAHTAGLTEGASDEQ
jgi:hypothetical protein